MGKSIYSFCMTVAPEPVITGLNITLMADVLPSRFTLEWLQKNHIIGKVWRDSLEAPSDQGEFHYAQISRPTGPGPRYVISSDNAFIPLNEQINLHVVPQKLEIGNLGSQHEIARDKMLSIMTGISEIRALSLGISVHEHWKVGEERFAEIFSILNNTPKFLSDVLPSPKSRSVTYSSIQNKPFVLVTEAKIEASVYEKNPVIDTIYFGIKFEFPISNPEETVLELQPVLEKNWKDCWMKSRTIIVDALKLRGVAHV